MKTSVKRLLAIAFFLMSSTTMWLHAQENEHARAMHKAILEMVNTKFSNDLNFSLKPFSEEINDTWWGEYKEDYRLVPEEKLYPVKLTKGKELPGPYYIDRYEYSFETDQIPDQPIGLLKPLLDAFDKQAPFATSYYSYISDDEKPPFPGVNIALGVEGKYFRVSFHPKMNVRLIGFKDYDGFRSTYVLAWVSHSLEYMDPDTLVAGNHKRYQTYGCIHEFHCPQIKSVPQIKPCDFDEDLNRSNISSSVAYNLIENIQKSDPARAAVLAADTLEERYTYSYHKMIQKLYNSPDSIQYTSHDALTAKVQRMAELVQKAKPLEQKVICHTLLQEVNNYPFLLSNSRVEKLMQLTDKIAAAVADDLKPQVISARNRIGAIENQTSEMEYLSKIDQEYLNRNFWKLTHLPVDLSKYLTEEQAGEWSRIIFTNLGQHYSDDQHMGYLEAKEEATKGYQAENTLRNLQPGRYRLSAVVRAAKAKHSGAYIFCMSGEGGEILRREIPADGDTGGNVWFSAYHRIQKHCAAKEGVAGLDFSKMGANGGQGYGWNRIYIEDIIVKDGTLTYGVSSRPEITSSTEIGSKWFSACDFIIERMGDLP